MPMSFSLSQEKNHMRVINVTRGLLIIVDWLTIRQENIVLGMKMTINVLFAARWVSLNKIRIDCDEGKRQCTKHNGINSN